MDAIVFVSLFVDEALFIVAYVMHIFRLLQVPVWFSFIKFIYRNGAFAVAKI